MIAPVSSIQSSSAVLAGSSPFSYLQLFELKAQKLRDEYLKNRGCPVRYRNWIAHLASAQKWEVMREAIMSYRHDSAEFDPLNAFYLAKLDKELENDHKASFELMMFYHLSFPDDIESIFILSSLAVDTKATPINDNRLVKAIRLILNSEIARLQKECDKELKTYDWLEEFSLFMNSKHAPSRMARVPVFVFIEILKHVANRVNPARVAAFDEEISFQIKQNPFEARLLAYALLYYVILQDHTKADSLFKRLSELADNPSCEVIFALAKYESLKGNSVKALEWVSNDRAINLACCNLRLNLLSALGRNEEWMQLFEKIDKAFSYPKALTPSRIWFFEKKAKQSLNDNKLDDAEKYINEILKIDPKNKNALHALVLVYLKRKKYKEAWSYFESKQKEAPSEKDFFIAALIAKRSYMRLCETEAFLKANIRFNENADELTIAIIDLLICQSKYQEALDYVAKLSKLDDNQKIMRDVIRLRMGIPPVMSLDELKKGVYLEWYLAELSASKGDHEEALKQYGIVSYEADVDTIRVYLASLMAVGKIQEAKDFLAKLDDNRKIRLRELRHQIEAAKIEEVKRGEGPKKTIDSALPKFVEKTEKVLIGLTPNAISLLKETFSRKPCCGNEGIDPIIYPAKHRIDLTIQNSENRSFTYYPDSYCRRIKSALDLFDRFKETYKKPQTIENAYILIYHLVSLFDLLSPSNPNSDQKTGMTLFSSRVLSTDVLSAIRANLLFLPALVSDIGVFKFSKAFIECGFEHAIKLSFSDPEPLSVELPSFKLETGEAWESLKDHIQMILHFDVIRNELLFMRDRSSVYLSEKDPEEVLIPFFVSAERIYASIEFIRAFDPERGDKLMKVFPELYRETSTPFDYSIRSLNKLMALAKLKSTWLESC